MESIVPRRQNRAKCLYRPLQRAKIFIPPASTGKIFIPPEIWLPAANYALVRNATFSTNLDTKRRVLLERHGSDVTRVNTAFATLGRVHFALVTIGTMPPLVHNLLLCMFFHWNLPSSQCQSPPLYSYFFARVEKGTRIHNPEPSLLKVVPFGEVSVFSYSGSQIHIFFVSLRNFDIVNFKFSQVL